jgi:hypothetical protein
MLRSENIDKILPAIALVKKELVGVTKGSNNPFYKSKYANLNEHLDVVEPLLEKNGLTLLQPPVANGETNTVESIIFHIESGQYMGSSINLVGESDMQKAGSAVTYGRRYTLGGLLAIKALDDDGNAASGKETKQTKSNKSEDKKPPSRFNGGFRTPKAKPETSGDDW